MNSRTCLPAALAALTALVFPTAGWGENEIGFIEKFALAADREKALGELVPGSEDYYFFHALHYQNTRHEAKLTAILDQWKARFPDESARRRVIENREALLDYDATPQKTLAYLKERLGLQFNHQREVRDQKPDLPIVLDQKRIARDVFEKDALANDESLDSLTSSAHEQLLRNKTPLTLAQKRALLSHLQNPDVPGLVELIASELKAEESQGFGTYSIHNYLLPAQLDALAKLVPAVAVDEEFVVLRLQQLAPSADVDVDFDPAEREAWLERLWAYAKTLPPAFNTIKTQVLYRRLDHDRKKGVYDPARFLEYLKIPREADYINSKWLEKTRDEHRSDLSVEPDGVFPGAQPIGSDEELVREYFLAIFQRAAAANVGRIGEGMMAPYTEYVRSAWLRPLLAEALITGGHGNPERWAPWLTPGEFQALKDRVDIEFPATNAQSLQPGDEPQFEVVLKNTPKVLVKIYELNALNFFLTQGRQLNTDINLDGLVANSEQTHSYENGPFKRSRETFKFPELKGKRGAWIIEFIGGGRSSRALLRAGQWQVLPQRGPAGDLLLVLDEKGEPVKDAVAWLDGRKYTTDEKLGRIIVPYSANTGARQLVLSDPAGTFATLTQFEHHDEDYAFDVQFHVEREQLLARREATVAVRAALRLGDVHLDPKLLREPKLTITSTTLDGIATTREVRDLKLSAGSVLTHTFTVPERLEKLDVTLSGEVTLLSKGGEKRQLTASRSWTLNGMDKSEATSDGHLAKFEGNYVYEMLGKNGEAIAEQEIVFTFHRHGFQRPQSVKLKSDDKGRVLLGALQGIEKVQAQSPNGRTSVWTLDPHERTWSETVHAKAGDVIRIPWQARVPGAPAAEEPAASICSLLEVRGDTCVADHKAKMAIKDGFLEIAPLTPGDYALWLKDDEREVSIHVTEGRQVGGWYLGKHRRLQMESAAPVNITSITADKDALVVKVANVSAFTRVHVAASRFEPGQSLFESLARFERFDPAQGKPAKLPNLYSAGREIGDEYRYILDRRYAKQFAGNMLARPGLLLNPWAVRDTGLDELLQKAKQDAARTKGEKAGEMAESEPVINRYTNAASGGAASETNLDFLAAGAPVLYNLIPEADGTVKIDRKSLGDRQHVQVYVEDLSNAAFQSFALPEAETKFADQRLVRNLDPAKPSTQKREVTVLENGRALTLDDVRTGEIETYDTLGGIHSLLTTLSGNPTLAQFAWVLQWPALKDEEKRAKYSEFACHELNFFLARKDPAFFDKVIKPALANKKDKTFMDDFLLGKDLAAYLEPWAYGRLNVVERALLAQRIQGEPANVSRNLRELWELLPPNPDLLERLFETALRGRALEMDAARGDVTKALKEAKVTWDVPAAPPTAAAGAVPRLDAPPLPPTNRPQPAAPVTTPDGKVTERFQRKLADGTALDARELEALAELDPNSPKLGSGQQLPQLQQALGRARDREEALGKRLFATQDEFAFRKAENFFAEGDVKLLQGAVRAYYRALGPTKEWAENNYYHLRIGQQDGGLIPVNAFWRDYARWVGDGAKGAFISPNVAEAHRNFTEMMLALAVLDLPFEAPKHATKVDGGKLTLTAGGPVIVFHKEVKDAAPAGQGPQLLVSQSFFRHGDRYRQEGNEKVEKYVTGEFLAGVVYGANVVVTNPASAAAKADVLLQIPQGAVPVLNSKMTDSRSVRLAPYTTQTFAYHFYFPKAEGKKFAHFPVHVAAAGTVVGSAKPFEFNVVGKLTEIDKASWDYVSQESTEAEVFGFLEQNNVTALNLDRLAWRCRDAMFFKKITAFLAAHHAWNDAIYSYAILHNDSAALREWLKRNGAFVAQCGPWLSTKLILLDPIERRSYEHLEYSPLVNQRAHRLGGEHRIANPAVLGQYQSLLHILAHKPALDPSDSMSVTYYLFLQDRVEEALTRFRAIDAKVLPVKIQHDYFRCYADFYEGNLAEARLTATKYAEYPVPRWKALFAGVTSQLDEIEGKGPAKKPEGEKPDREAQQSTLTATEPAFDFKVENRVVALNYALIPEITVNYYLMDPEFSFSSSPFVSQDASRFSIVKPTKTTVHPLPKEQAKLDIDLPPEFAKANVLVEVVGAGQRKAQAYHANTLKIIITDNYGRLEARDSATDKPVPTAYVKVYARLKNGTVRFYKDGYTDLRGRFDYASLNTPAAQPVPVPQPPPPPGTPVGLNHQMLKPAELPQVEKLAILILSETNGATTREVKPPSQ